MFRCCFTVVYLEDLSHNEFISLHLLYAYAAILSIDIILLSDYMRSSGIMKYYT